MSGKTQSASPQSGPWRLVFGFLQPPTLKCSQGRKRQKSQKCLPAERRVLRILFHRLPPLTGLDGLCTTTCAARHRRCTREPRGVFGFRKPLRIWLPKMNPTPLNNIIPWAHYDPTVLTKGLPESTPVKPDCSCVVCIVSPCLWSRRVQSPRQSNELAHTKA